MTKKALVECSQCGWTIEGDVPNDKPEGWNYQIKGDLEESIKNHHLETRVEVGSQRLFGHNYFNVELENGKTGEIHGNSHSVFYKEFNEFRGKERE